VRLGNC